MPKLKDNTVYAALRRRESLVGDIVRIGLDEWGLKEWFQNMPALKNGKATTSTKKGKKRKAKGKGRRRPQPVSVAGQVKPIETAPPPVVDPAPRPRLTAR